MYTFATLSFPHFDCTFGSPKMRHMCYTLATLSIPTPHVHFCYTFLSHTLTTPFANTLATLSNPTPHVHFCYTFLYHTLTTPFGNQKCVTFITLWLHFAFPHCDYTFGSPKMRHIKMRHIYYILPTLSFPTL
jgi:hypothetical protein